MKALRPIAVTPSMVTTSIPDEGYLRWVPSQPVAAGDYRMRAGMIFYATTDTGVEFEQTQPSWLSGAATVTKTIYDPVSRKVVVFSDSGGVYKGVVGTVNGDGSISFGVYQGLVASGAATHGEVLDAAVSDTGVILVAVRATNGDVYFYRCAVVGNQLSVDSSYTALWVNIGSCAICYSSELGCFLIAYEDDTNGRVGLKIAPVVGGNVFMSSSVTSDAVVVSSAQRVGACAAADDGGVAVLLDAGSSYKLYHCTPAEGVIGAAVTVGSGVTVSGDQGSIRKGEAMTCNPSRGVYMVAWASSSGFAGKLYTHSGNALSELCGFGEQLYAEVTEATYVDICYDSISDCYTVALNADVDEGYVVSYRPDYTSSDDLTVGAYARFAPEMYFASAARVSPSALMTPTGKLLVSYCDAADGGLVKVAGLVAYAPEWGVPEKIGSAATWIRLRRDNRYAQFSGGWNERSVATGEIWTEIDVSEPIDGLALMGVQGSTVTCEVTSSTRGVVFSGSVSIEYVQPVIFLGLDAYAGDTVRYSVTGSGDVEVVECLVGSVIDLGISQNRSVSVGSSDTSLQRGDDYGEMRVTVMSSRKWGRVDFKTKPVSRMAEIRAFLDDIPGLPCVWIPGDEHADFFPAAVWGLRADDRMWVDGGKVIVGSIEIEGMRKLKRGDNG